MMLTAHALNTLWMCASRRAYVTFQRATHDAQGTQARLLRGMVQAQRATEFGRRHGFARIASPAQFQDAVPLGDYSSHEPFITRMADGELGVLTREPVRLFEPTSGTLAGRKLIPCTAGLQAQFQRAIGAWMHDLLRHHPAVRRGRAFWSISPPEVQHPHTAAGIPIGFASDTEYLGPFERRMTPHLMAAPGELAACARGDAYSYALLYFLLAAGDLALISVWSPTFLTSLLPCLLPWGERLVHDLQHGTLSGPDAGSVAYPPALLRRLHPQPARAALLRDLLRGHAAPAELHMRLWPALALISCWADAAAATYLPALQAMFPRVPIQPKGLIATEAFVSFPVTGHEGSALAVTSHFFEFEPAADHVGTGAAVRPLLAHQLDAGQRYRVIVTTAGGLYRYALRDEIEVVGHFNQTPMIRFIGKCDLICDLVGEKLHEPHVRAACTAACAELGVEPAFLLVLPASIGPAGAPAGYRLYLQPTAPLGEPSQFQRALADAVQQRLLANPHYRYAIELRQLAPLAVTEFAATGDAPWRCYEALCIAAGQKRGDIKPTALGRDPQWHVTFDALAR